LKAGGAVIVGGEYLGPTLHPASVAHIAATGNANKAASGLREFRFDIFIKNTPN